MIALIRRLQAAVERFFLEPASDRPLVALRISVAAVLLLETLFINSSALDLFGRNIDGHWNFGRFGARIGYPRLQFVYNLFHLGGAGQTAAITIFGILYMGSLLALMVGWRQRASGALSLWLNFMFASSDVMIPYGIDRYTRWSLFYLVFAPKTPRRVRLLVRIAQIHLAITYVFNAVPKFFAPTWWSGNNLFAGLNTPIYHSYDFAWLVNWQGAMRALSAAALVLEAGFPVFVWIRKVRPYWVAGMVSLHLMIALFLRLDLFGILMAALCFSLFGVSAERESRAVLETSPVLGMQGQE